ncbi:MAG: cyclase family protein [Chloroflexi bacterium]|nr:cyclase family protein [Chloroflexota bacterium]
MAHTQDQAGRSTRLRIIDLSVPLKNGAQEPLPPQITYMGHAETARDMGPLFGLRPDDFPEAKFCAAERVTLSTHSGTHLDAPWHYWPTSQGKPARTIDQVPLEWCYGDGVVLDFSHRKRGDLITAEDVQQALRQIGYAIKPFDIVLIRTDASKHFDEPGNDLIHPGMSREATLWLIDQGVRVVGIDAWGWDRPFDLMAADVKAGHKDQLWQGHYAGREREYCHIEKLCNLDRIPTPYGFKVAVFPVNIQGASAGWCRPVAIMEE